MDEPIVPEGTETGNPANRVIEHRGFGKPYYSTSEAASVLRVKPKFVMNLITRGKIQIERGKIEGAAKNALCIPRSEMARMAAQLVEGKIEQPKRPAVKRQEKPDKPTKDPIKILGTKKPDDKPRATSGAVQSVLAMIDERIAQLTNAKEAIIALGLIG